MCTEACAGRCLHPELTQKYCNLVLQRLNALLEHERAVILPCMIRSRLGE